MKVYKNIKSEFGFSKKVPFQYRNIGNDIFLKCTFLFLSINIELNFPTTEVVMNLEK